MLRKGHPLGYYTCSKRASPYGRGDGVRCSLKPLKAEVLDQAVWSDLCELMTDSTRIARYAGLDTEATREQLQTQVEHLHREIQACDRQLQRLLDAYQQGAIEMQNLLARRKPIDARKTLLADSLSEAQGVLGDARLRHSFRKQLPHLVCQVQQALVSADSATRRRLLRLLIDRVVVQPNLDLEIHYVVPGPGRLAASLPTPGDPHPEGNLPNRDRPLSGDFGLHSERELALRVQERPSGQQEAPEQVEHGQGGDRTAQNSSRIPPRTSFW
jgi:site-specific DNA recombinase